MVSEMQRCIKIIIYHEKQKEKHILNLVSEFSAVSHYQTICLTCRLFAAVIAEEPDSIRTLFVSEKRNNSNCSYSETND